MHGMNRSEEYSGNQIVYMSQKSISAHAHTGVKETLEIIHLIDPRLCKLWVEEEDLVHVRRCIVVQSMLCAEFTKPLDPG